MLMDSPDLLRDGILSVKEDSTCHYVMEVGIMALCNVPGFTQPKPKVRLSTLEKTWSLHQMQVSRVVFSILQDQDAEW